MEVDFGFIFKFYVQQQVASDVLQLRLPKIYSRMTTDGCKKVCRKDHSSKTQMAMKGIPWRFQDDVGTIVPRTQCTIVAHVGLTQARW